MDPNALAAHIRKVFGRFADFPMWVAWESRPHSDPSKPPTKVPINPFTGYPASVSNPQTWAPMGKALATAQRNKLAGIGIVLGPDPDANPDSTPDKPYLVGVDYDNALRPDGTLTEWAENLYLAGTYAEVSPSGTGVKAFAVVDSRPDGLPSDRDGVTLRLGDITPAVDGKRPAVEIYTARRWFAVTGQTYRDSDSCRIANMSARLPVLLRHAPQEAVSTLPAPPQETADEITAADARDVYAAALTDADRAGLTRAIQTHADLAKAMVGADWLDRSGALFSAADLAKGYRLTFAQFVHGIMAADGAAGAHVRDQPDPFRALARAWERSPQPAPLTGITPVPEGAQIGDRPGVQGDGYVAPVDLSVLDSPNPLGTPYTLPVDLYRNPPPLPGFVLPGLFPSAPAAMVGTGGVMKSTIWMSLALHMLLDRPVWGRMWWEGGSALMVSKEDERDTMLRRLHDLLHGMDVTERQYRDIVARRFYLDDMTSVGVRLVESDGRGNLVVTPTADALIDKYRGRNVAFAAMDPMVNFGAGEAHGNDGAAIMMQIAWRIMRGWAEDGGRCNLCYIHHLSMAAAREEIEDSHAGRSASAIGDNARSVWVLHRHKVQNVHRHVAPASVPAEAIERGDVIRMMMAKNSYARRIMEPFWVWRDGDRFHYEEPLDPVTARTASAQIPTVAEQNRLSREDGAREALRDWCAVRPDFTRREFVETSGIHKPIAQRTFEAWRVEGILERAPTVAERWRLTPPPAETAASYGF